MFSLLHIRLVSPYQDISIDTSLMDKYGNGYPIISIPINWK